MITMGMVSLRWNWTKKALLNKTEITPIGVIFFDLCLPGIG